jgi:predicted amidohydrolase
VTAVRIALAAPPVAASLDEGLQHVHQALHQAARQDAVVVCFPEAYLPGLRGLDFPVPDYARADQERVLQSIESGSRSTGVGVVLGMEWLANGHRHIAAAVVGSGGELLGVQTKNQLDPSEESHYVPGSGRRLFEIGGLRFGVAICHEGFRYPETVRWAAMRGAQVVFHPHCTGSDLASPRAAPFAAPEAPYYERAMLCRALENTVYFASVNYAFRHQESATCIITPAGDCLARLPYGKAGVLVADLDPAAATGLLASRYAPDRHTDLTGC